MESELEKPNPGTEGKEGFIKKSISLKKYQGDFIDNESINLSRLVQKLIDKKIEEKKQFGKINEE